MGGEESGVIFIDMHSSFIVGMSFWVWRFCAILYEKSPSCDDHLLTTISLYHTEVYNGLSDWAKQPGAMLMLFRKIKVP